MGFIIVIAFTRLLISCHPFILKILYFRLNSFRLFMSSLLTMVHTTSSAERQPNIRLIILPTRAAELFTLTTQAVQLKRRPTPLEM